MCNFHPEPWGKSSNLRGICLFKWVVQPPSSEDDNLKTMFHLFLLPHLDPYGSSISPRFPSSASIKSGRTGATVELHERWRNTGYLPNTREGGHGSFFLGDGMMMI